MVSGLVRWIGFLTITAAVVGLVVLAFGFFWFISQVPDEEVSLSRNADGIVVLTGAATRIPDALELLNSKRGGRLLTAHRGRRNTPSR